MRERGRRSLTAIRRAVTAVRGVDHLPRVAVTGVAALALLTTFTSAAPSTTPDTAPVVAPEPPQLGLGREIVRDVAAAPQLEGELAAELGLVRDIEPDIPEVGGERELTPFERSPIGEVTETDVVEADLIVRAEEGEVDPEALAGSLADAQHAAAAAGLTATTPVADADVADADDHELTVLGVDAATFRPLTPEVTAAADAVWERFAEGDVLVAHELAEALDLELGGTLELVTATATVPVRIGAFAANGAPPVADVLAPVEVARQLGVHAPNTLVVAAGSGDPHQLGEALADATGGEVEVRREPAAAVTEAESSPAQLSTHAPRGRIEPFTYTSRSDGRITIHGDWVARNIVRVQLPRMAATSCHRAMVPQLHAAVEELIERGLYDHLDPSQFAGCFVARHIDWNPSKPLSMHAWGLAIDFNSRDNALGAQPRMDPRVVEVFKRWGFDWGGDWRRPDGMHFELARVVPTP